MKWIITILLFCYSFMAYGFSLSNSAFKNNGYIPAKYASCVTDGHGGKRYTKAISPPLQWQGAPKGTGSYVLLMADHSIPEQSAMKGFYKSLPKTLPRETGYHWVLVNIPTKYSALPAGIGTSNIGQMQYGIEGINYFSRLGHAIIGGYGGPCPPPNDSVVHHYVFTLYALDEANLDVPASGGFTGEDVLAAIKGHVLAKAVLTGKYSTK